MSPRRSLAVAAVVGFLLAWSVWQAGPRNDPPQDAPDQPAAIGTEPAAARYDPIGVSSPSTGDADFLLDVAADPLVGLVGEGLNSADGSALRDLRIMSEILEAWQTNFPGKGNPVGLNREITRALTGQNSLNLPFLPTNHPAINAEGEICDRWGSPLVFHQISKYHMELRSAGPDRRHYSEDDLLWNEAESF